MEGLTVGRIVHYIPDQFQIDGHIGPGHPWEAGRHYAAVIAKVANLEEGTVYLAVVSEWGWQAPRGLESRRLDEEPSLMAVPNSIDSTRLGCWHWPRNCDQ